MGLNDSKHRKSLLWVSTIGLVTFIAVFGYIYFEKSHITIDNADKVYNLHDKKKYIDALQIAMQFFDVQKAGKLENNKIEWRGDSSLDDGKEANLDLSKGMYDDGSHMKSTYTMSSTAAILSWVILEYGARMKSVNQLEPACDSLKWITDYLINTHPEPNKLCIQVGDPDVDHNCWERPETMDEARTLLIANKTSPASDIAAETAAALASASMVFKIKDPNYSEELLHHAEQLFNFAYGFQKMANNSFPDMANYYKNSNDIDEIMWASVWLYHATDDAKYRMIMLEYRYGDPQYQDMFSFTNKLGGAEHLWLRLHLFGTAPTVDAGEEDSLVVAYNEFLCNLPVGPESEDASTARRYDDPMFSSTTLELRLPHASKRAMVASGFEPSNTNQYPAAYGFIALLCSDYMLATKQEVITCTGSGNQMKRKDFYNFALKQADYILGENKQNMSYLIGFGSKYPQQVYHRGSSIPGDENPSCKEGLKWLWSSKPNPNVATGGLIGGQCTALPFNNSRVTTLKQTEPNIFNSALLVGLLSGLVSTTPVGKTLTPPTKL
ncbi:hypothetical protein GIB67_005398 [Kingdonia uniflora]|uniref:cellulase n=1 Tax=Kingdonia uniflora TaxID=39325 RepID=A0A7J7NH74_9MAGN|nr:hypothetical protein GIB67_005398 [Kingdonia uniflora]